MDNFPGVGNAALAVVLLACLWITGCAAPVPPHPAERPPASPSVAALPTTDYFPTARTAPGWGRQSAVRRYVAQGLYEYVDGDADIYLRYGFKSVATVLMENHAISRSGVIIDAFEMGSPLQAFGIFASRRAGGANVPHVGAEACYSDGMLTFYQDAWFARLYSPSLSKTVTPALLARLGRVLAHALPGKAQRPPELGLFPTSGLIPDSVRYVSDRPLGFDFLPAGFTAEYRVGSRHETAFAVPIGDVAGARAAMERFAALLHVTPTTVPTGSVGMQGTAPHRGPVVVRSQGRFVTGLLAASDATGLLERLLKAMQTRDAMLPTPK